MLGELTLGQGGQRGSWKAILSKGLKEGRRESRRSLGKSVLDKGERNRKIRRHELTHLAVWKEGPCCWRERGDRGVGAGRVLGAMGRAGDVILLAGKGHETWQEIGEERIPLDEREEIASFFREDAL